MQTNHPYTAEELMQAKRDRAYAPPLPRVVCPTCSLVMFSDPCTCRTNLARPSTHRLAWSMKMDWSRRRVYWRQQARYYLLSMALGLALWWAWCAWMGR